LLAGATTGAAIAPMTAARNDRRESGIVTAFYHHGHRASQLILTEYKDLTSCPQ
jgi:hypothetical protein